MERIAEQVERFGRRLSSSGQVWALVGGLAVSIRGEPRFTRDIDLAIAVGSDREAEQLVHHLLGAGYRTEMVLEHEQTGRLSTVRVVPVSEPQSMAVIDLLFASSGIEPEIAAAATAVNLTASVRVPVAATGHLIALKTLSRDDDRRPQDRMDLQALIENASAADLQLAPTLCS